MLAREDLFNKALEERIGKYHRTAEEISGGRNSRWANCCKHMRWGHLAHSRRRKDSRAEQSSWRDWQSRAGVCLLRPGRVNVSGIFCAIWPVAAWNCLQWEHEQQGNQQGSPAHLGSHLPTKREPAVKHLQHSWIYWKGSLVRGRSEKRLEASAKG